MMHYLFVILKVCLGIFLISVVSSVLFMLGVFLSVRKASKAVSEAEAEKSGFVRNERARKTEAPNA